jgi:hypothetical protein
MEFNIESITELINELKHYIEEGNVENLTVGYDPKTGEWDYQTGDNSYSGAAYFYPVWGVGTIFPLDCSADLAKDIVNQILDQAEHYNNHYGTVAA